MPIPRRPLFTLIDSSPEKTIHYLSLAILPVALRFSTRWQIRFGYAGKVLRAWELAREPTE